jgi:murein L,D-transpeptidase YcbB/YkuD
MIATHIPGTNNMRHFFQAAMLLTLGILPLLSGKSWSQDPIEAEITSRISSHELGDNFGVNEETIYGNNFIASLYKASSNKRVWSDDSINSLKSEIQNMESDALNPGDYWSDPITKLVNEKNRDSLTAASVVDLDILLSEAFIRAYYNLLVGKVDPEGLDSNFNFPKPLDVEHLLPVAITKVREGKISESLNDARLKNSEHVNLKKALAQYNAFQADGGWNAIDGGKTLKPGQHNPRVAQLRARLGVTGDYTGNADDPSFYDADLETAVNQFQKRHGLDIDGAVGANTLAALNISVEQKINQIRVNLERQRWYMHENFGEFMVADIAGFNVYWVKEDGEVL